MTAPNQTPPVARQGQMAGDSPDYQPYLLVCEVDALRWYFKASEQDELVYHKGRLICDRDKDFMGLSDQLKAELVKVADFLLGKALAGEIRLFQRRVSPFCFEYVAKHLARAPFTQPLSA